MKELVKEKYFVTSYHQQVDFKSGNATLMIGAKDVMQLLKLFQSIQNKKRDGTNSIVREFGFVSTMPTEYVGGATLLLSMLINSSNYSGYWAYSIPLTKIVNFF